MASKQKQQKKRGYEDFCPGEDPMDNQPYYPENWAYVAYFHHWLEGWNEAKNEYEVEVEVEYEIENKKTRK